MALPHYTGPHIFLKRNNVILLLLDRYPDALKIKPKGVVIPLEIYRQFAVN